MQIFSYLLLLVTEKINRWQVVPWITQPCRKWHTFQEESLRVNWNKNQDTSMVERQARDLEVRVRIPVQVQIFLLKFIESFTKQNLHLLEQKLLVSCALLSMLVGPSRINSSGVRFPVRRGWNDRNASMACKCHCVKECVNFIIWLII